MIAGQDVVTAEFVESLNPSHKREVVGRFGKATAQHAQQAIAAAKAAFPQLARHRARRSGRSISSRPPR